MIRYVCYIFAVLISLLAMSCEKVVFDCDYTVKMYEVRKEQTPAPTEQEPNKTKDTLITSALPKALLYGFYADTAEWTVGGYDRSIEGLIVSRKSASETKRADFTALTNDLGVATMEGITSKPLLIVACDTLSKYYAWMVADVDANLPTVIVPIRFELWRNVEQYKQGRWTIINEFVTVTPPETGGGESEGGGTNGNGK